MEIKEGYHGEGIDQRMLTFHPKYQANFKYEEDDVYSAFRDHILTYDENEEIELVKRLGDPTTTLCQCLWYLMENRKWNYPETFNDRTGLHKNYHGRIPCSICTTGITGQLPLSVRMTLLTFSLNSS